MSGELLTYVVGRAQGGLEIGKTVDLFRRYAYIEHSCVRALAGWFLKNPDWETKIVLGYALFAHSERLYELHGRLEEMRGGNRNANLEPELDRFGEEILHAPDKEGFTAGLILVLHRLEAAYREHLDATDASANALEIRMLRRLLQDVAQEIADLEKLGHTEPSGAQNREATRAWACYLDSLLRVTGGIGGMQPREGGAVSRPVESIRFEWPMSIHFDERLQTAEMGTYESKKSLPLRERCIGEFEVYFNEFYAAAQLATVIYESWKLNAPRQYFMDIAHHFWDEVRHAEFGAIRLRELGREPNKINMVLFEQSRNMPLLHRLCYLTLGLEVFFMPRKSERVRYYEQQRDFRSQLLADVDWSDEVNHVRYGKRWIEYFLQDDARTVEDVQTEISNYLAEFQQNMPDGRKAPW
ncbi:DUF455 family protein [Paenibacillus sp. BC26]|uniref:DUF455 family protein n=1 Tax=Paenibacillus sp. BC26 TaxID=1881032 RepID=UPI0008EE0194|nr:DUF455 family protein [Paenibacillus sp. BC26]SFS74396.1 Protein of unknown function [Paenibacillus sp. BC26]